MDTLAAIALATEPPSKQGLGPKAKPQDPIMAPVMVRQIFGQSIYQIIVMIVLIYAGPIMFDINYNYIETGFYDSTTSSENKTLHYTLMFNTFMMMTIFNEVNCRRLSVRDLNIFSEFFNNKSFLLVLLTQIGLQLVMVEYGGRIFRTTPLPILMVTQYFNDPYSMLPQCRSEWELGWSPLF